MADGTVLYPIDCNPRAHTAHALVEAYLSLLEPGDKKLASCDYPDPVTPITPPKSLLDRPRPRGAAAAAAPRHAQAALHALHTREEPPRLPYQTLHLARQNVRAMGPAAVVLAVPRVLAAAVLGLFVGEWEVEQDERQHDEDV